MNERIKELKEQCWSKIWICHNCNDRGFNHEKFAELLIEECANLCELRYVEHKDLSDESVEAMMCCNAIREHFGVEE